ncbi:MAG: hypothetical protein M1830_002728 [Pleopsidium flavum]|nr:MAG: hypothetical protein M1830_002728 [Pleopsidium flavum]
MVYSVGSVMKAIKTRSCMSEIDDVIHAFNPDGDSVDKVLYILEKALTKAQGAPHSTTWKEWQQQNSPVYDTILAE